ncbi:hypothetical protein [Vibrio alginolyticus]|uniref:hypothetical protein n=1 Tax=Vibrio alginolyticus TaxID=663 RepID=UPI0015F3645C|nr:hypothetical protein [Vibrio alginolyticus]
MSSVKVRATIVEDNTGIPRQRMKGTAHLGWKNRVVDHKDNYIQVHVNTHPNTQSSSIRV